MSGAGDSPAATCGMITFGRTARCESVSDIPQSMTAELQAWNSGKGVDLNSWVGCEGNFALAVGYSTLFWPRLVEFEGYILHAGFSVDALRGFEASSNGNRSSIEAVMNHRHIADMQHVGCADISFDKIKLLGGVLREMYEAKLAWQFPNKPCEVRLFLEGETDVRWAHEVTFWQKPQSTTVG